MQNTDHTKRLHSIKSLSKQFEDLRGKNKLRRRPVGTENKLAAPTREGFQRRWVNDVTGRVEEYLRAGWVAVINEPSSSDPTLENMGAPGTVVNQHVGGGTIAFLLEIPQEYYDESQRAKNDALDMTERGLHEGIASDPYTDSAKGFYGKTKVEHPTLTEGDA